MNQLVIAIFPDDAKAYETARELEQPSIRIIDDETEAFGTRRTTLPPQKPTPHIWARTSAGADSTARTKT